jgi:hypothetical protein
MAAVLAPDGDSDPTEKGEMMDWLKAIFGGAGGVTDIIKTTGDAIGQFVDKPEDKLKMQQALAEADLAVRKLAFDAQNAYLADVQSARDLYKSDNILQKVFALTFLVGYLALTAAVLWFLVSWIGGQKIALPDWGVALISTIYGGMSTKVSTIVDFFFGSSQGSRDKDTQIQTAISKVPTQTP